MQSACSKSGRILLDYACIEIIDRGFDNIYLIDWVRVYTFATQTKYSHIECGVKLKTKD